MNDPRRGLQAGLGVYARVGTHYHIQEASDMPVGQALKDIDLALEVIEELRAEATSVHRLDRNLVMCLLYPRE